MGQPIALRTSALCLDKLPKSERSETTAGKVARACSEVRRTCSEVRPRNQDDNLRATNTDMFMGPLSMPPIPNTRSICILGPLFMLQITSRL